ncbi:hypothetical protein EGR_10771 [Echinococcus granulosus]|uniref:Uncharacterized protein n=1 Tax=Echinococcus granulosus TaxID=6210 RepID=W6ULG0_ECHGR|nr:hypothetical protein EGR_10771 [Echinococcus granulosus]EUB54374.1 hypothetical protein EGR_10771 [Echinococcus granulosus]
MPPVVSQATSFHRDELVYASVYGDNVAIGVLQQQLPVSPMLTGVQRIPEDLLRCCQPSTTTLGKHN